MCARVCECACACAVDRICFQHPPTPCKAVTRANLHTHCCRRGAPTLYHTLGFVSTSLKPGRLNYIISFARSTYRGSRKRWPTIYLSHARWAFLLLEGTTRRRPFSEQARNQHGVHLWPQVEHFPRFFLWTINVKISNKL